MQSQLLEHELDRVELEFAVDLGRGHRRDLDSDEAYYPQIEREIRLEAAGMAPHYEVFYSLERTVRLFVSETLAEDNSSWWAEVVPEKVREDAEARRAKDADTGFTIRSDDPLDYTTFGELGQIILSNWDVFGQTFTSRRAVERVTSNLNTLRGAIAHCSPLADDEVVRLRLSVRDWFRLQS